MARKKSQTLTDAELRLMNILWEKDACTVNDVLAELPEDQPLAYSTVLTFLRILEKKGYISHKKRGRAFVYSPIVDRESARESVVKYVVSQFFDNSAFEMISKTLQCEKVSSAEAGKLKGML